jgi:BirA family biotin operon repressor/biotin-[acetyl-CoA-carboxylase] ligase
VQISPIGHTVISLAEVDSTNNYAATLLNETKVTNGTIVLAQNQVKGKGQRGSMWFVEPNKNLTFSIILTDLKIPANKQFLISMWVANVLSSFLKEKFLIKNNIKWPNDIIVNRRKIAGILIENSLKGQFIQNSIVGVGFNVNQTNFPDEILATSLKSEINKELELNEVFDALITSFNQSYLHFAKQDEATLFENYYAKLYGYKSKISLKDADGNFEGIISKVLPDGRLVIHKSGSEKIYSLKELQFLLEK